MIKRKGDLFTTDSDAIGHGVNVLGLMGAGIALPMKEKYPDNFESYEIQCKMKALTPGGVHIYPALELGRKSNYYPEVRIIVNMASQNRPGADASYVWLFQAADAAAKQLQEIGLRKVAIPLIGCGLGGLVWSHAEKVLEAVEVLNSGFQFEVWKYE